MVIVRTIRRSLLAVSVLGVLGFASLEADANVSSAPGTVFKTVSASQASQWNMSNYGSEVNNGTNFAYVVAQVPYSSANPLSVSLSISHNSWCQAVVTNGAGGGAWVGQQQFGDTAGLTWQTLALGTPPSWGGTALLVYCDLEPGATLGLVYQ